MQTIATALDNVQFCETNGTAAYRVVVYSQNSWHADGTRIIERDCGHKHRTLNELARCYHSLTKRLSDGTYLAAWSHAFVAHSDGSKLSQNEESALDDALYQHF